MLKFTSSHEMAKLKAMSFISMFHLNYTLLFNLAFLSVM